MSVLLAESANVSPVPSTNSARSTTRCRPSRSTIVSDEHRQHERAAEVGDDDHPAPIEAVRRRPADDPEQEHRQVLHEQRERHEERVAGLRRHEQRAGRERHAVADVVDSGRGEEPPEAPAQSAGRDGVGGARERGRHGA